MDLAYDYFAEAALMDLEDLEHNTRDGVHIASLAGTWLVAVAGFGGMRDHFGKLTFRPRLPDALTRLQFRLMFRGRGAAGRGRFRARPLPAAVRRAAERSSTTAPSTRSRPTRSSSLRSRSCDRAANPTQPPGRDARAQRRPNPRFA